LDGVALEIYRKIRDLQLAIPVDLLLDHTQAVFPEFALTDVDAKAHRQVSGIAQDLMRNFY